MSIKKKHNPIFITAAERSGSTLIAKILQLCGVELGEVNGMCENKNLQTLSRAYINDNSKDTPFPLFTDIQLDWKEQVASSFENKRWAYKSPFLTQMWRQWDYSFPDAHWIIVRRRTNDIINGCMKTGYLKLFKDKETRSLIQAQTEEEAWLWWIHKYENTWVDMIKKGVNCKMIWPERMVVGDYKQIYEMLEWLGVEWNNDIPSVIGKILKQDRR